MQNDIHESLEPTLSAWKVDPPSDPGFTADVFSRLEAERSRSWSAPFRAHPALAAAGLALAVAAGAWGGAQGARVQADGDRAAMAAAYVHSLDARWMRSP